MATDAIKIPFTEAAAPSTPSASKVVIYAKSDGLMYSKDDAGTETLMSGGVGGGSTVLDKAAVATSETTTSTSYTDLATPGPAVTVTVPASGAVRLSFSAEAENNGVNRTYIAYAVSGGTTTAASDTTGAVLRNSGGDPITIGRSLIIEGLATGSTTFTMKYRVAAGTGTFLSREINVETLP